ncbi:hypothetical protein K490DRAFT_63248 [Saccharata proteae CBS 121410]|uniref:Uncharacterized protein n=1 Tax=Saccharata proteae CBS 121410 TaxID=1314787 RepID=A0A9P4HZL5_9PEZI|nr:hypothetical protein K490DRAFT_63248 [Saccharata proteae CBS 121410]
MSSNSDHIFRYGSSRAASEATPAATANAAASRVEIHPNAQDGRVFMVQNRAFATAEDALDYALHVIEALSAKVRQANQKASSKQGTTISISRQLKQSTQNENSLREYSAMLRNEKEILEKKLEEAEKQRDYYHKDNKVLLTAFSTLNTENSKLGALNDRLKATALQKIGEKDFELRRSN